MPRYDYTIDVRVKYNRAGDDDVPVAIVEALARTFRDKYAIDFDGDTLEVISVGKTVCVAPEPVEDNDFEKFREAAERGMRP